MSESAAIRSWSDDGTSQVDRLAAALSPGYVELDERSTADVLRFAIAFARELRYFGLDGEDNGSWERFLGDESSIGELVRFLEDPTSGAIGDGSALQRPHVVLLLVFLELLGVTRRRINELLPRHLEFLYRDVLLMQKHGPRADHVNVILALADGVAEAPVAAGALLSAGPDADGKEQQYAVDRDVVINRAEIAHKRTVFVERRVTDFEAVRLENRDSKARRLLRVLELALGVPAPGDPLPRYANGWTGDHGVDPQVEIDGFAAQLALWNEVLAFPRESLSLEFAEVRQIDKLLDLRRDRDETDWAAIGEVLLEAARERERRTGQAVNFQFVPGDFEGSLEAAVGAVDFKGLPRVESLEDLAAALREGRADAIEFLREHLFLADGEGFQGRTAFVSRLMPARRRIYEGWHRINRILERGARRRGGETFRLFESDSPKSTEISAFEANFRRAFGDPSWPELVDPGARSFAGYFAALEELERYFQMSAEELVFLQAVNDKAKKDVLPGDWRTVDGFLARAHREKVFAARRDELRATREAAATPAEGVEAVFMKALGLREETEPEVLLARLEPLVSGTAEHAFLVRVHDAALAAGGTGAEQLDWARFYDVAERAWRVREGLPEPRAEKQRWVDVHVAEDAASVRANGPDAARWKTFGGRDPDRPARASIGWAVASPLLEASSGHRELTLTLRLGDSVPDAATVAERLVRPESDSPIAFQISTEDGWVEIEPAANPKAVEDSVVVVFVLDAAFAGVVPVNAEAHGMTDAWPVLRAMLRPVFDERGLRHETHYDLFQGVAVTGIALRVKVGGSDPKTEPGLTGLSGWRDGAEIDVTKPFEPFGLSPSVGSRLRVGHPDLDDKPLDELSFRVEWTDLPGLDLEAHYAAYPAKSFTAAMYAIDRGEETPVGTLFPLFRKNAASQTIRADREMLASFADRVRRQATRPSARDRKEPCSFALELTPNDFGHVAYPTLVARKSLELAVAATKDKAEKYLVNAPYTPKIKRLAVTYAASTELPAATSSAPPGIARMFHVHPFGHARVEPGASFLPELDADGQLLLGIAGATPPQNVAVLFQVAEGTADPDLEPEPVRWSYLDGERWRELEDGDIVFDSTRNLINSGIIEFRLRPAEAGTLMPRDAYWLRAAVARSVGAVCDAIDIRAQAVSATFVDRGNAPSRYERPLPAESITEPAARIPGIAGVEQPYTSFGGRPQEQDRLFHTRISERIRHKNRAVSQWDYERLVLDRFPEIYKAKCLPARDEPGVVEVVVIPDLRHRLPSDPFEPKASTALLADVQQYLAERASARARVRVRNAHYVPVRVRVGIRLREGVDQGFHVPLLERELSRFLSPWAFDEAADIVIGGRVHANSIVDFLDSRSYVDHVAQIRLFAGGGARIEQLSDSGADANAFAVAADRPDAVLVAARRHDIDLIPDAGYEPRRFTGINYMRIELDFQVGE